MQIGPTGEFLTPAAVAPSLPPFLRLPREIRDLIYDAVLGSTEEAPDIPSDAALVLTLVTEIAGS